MLDSSDEKLQYFKRAKISAVMKTYKVNLTKLKSLNNENIINIL